MSPRPRIDFLAPPFSGHLHPVLAMARQLSPHYDVRILSTPAAEERIRVAGMPAQLLMVGADDALSAIVNTREAVRGSPWRMYRQFHGVVTLLAALGSELAELYRTDPPDLLIADFTLPTGGIAAQRLGIPWWTSLPSPCILEAPDGPPPYFGGLQIRTDALGRVRDAVGRSATRGFKRGVFRLHRGVLRKAGLQRVYRTDGGECVYSPDRILALGLPQLEFARHWPAAVRFIGPMLYTPPMSSATPPFREGYRHVLVTLGTHLGWHKDAVAAAVRAIAAQFPDVMFHFTEGTMELGDVQSDANFARLPFVDYERWLSRYDLVLHHGGAGIMYYCIAKGRPAIVYPVDFDQFDHAARLAHAGLAVRLDRLRDLEATFRKALDDVELSRRCREFYRSREDSGHHLLDLISAQIPNQGSSLV